MTAAIWFRRGLRLHDNPALVKACESEKVVSLPSVERCFSLRSSSSLNQRASISAPSSEYLSPDQRVGIVHPMRRPQSLNRATLRSS